MHTNIFVSRLEQPLCIPEERYFTGGLIFKRQRNKTLVLLKRKLATYTRNAALFRDWFLIVESRVMLLFYQNNKGKFLEPNNRFTPYQATNM